MEELDRKVRAHYHLSGAGEDAETAGDKPEQKSGDKKNDAKKNAAESELSLAGGKKG